MSSKLLRPNKEIILLFALALILRIFVSALQVYFDLQDLTLPFPITAWHDFYVTYVVWLHSVSQGMIPYRDFFTYTYTPLFLYALYPFYLIGGAHAAAIPIVVSDAATSPVVYLLAKRLTSQRIAFVAGVTYAICPFALFYEGYLWLSSQPMAFFLMLSIYYMRSGKPTASFVAYGVSTMFKQQAVLILPAFLAWQFMKYRRRVWKGVALLLSVVFIVSLPFLLVSGGQYGASLGYQFLGSLSQVGTSHVTVAVGSLTQNTSSIILKPCPETLPTGGTPFACIKYPNPMLSSVLTSLDWISDALVIPFLFLAGAALFPSRQVRSQVELLLSYSLVCFLVLFSITVHVVAAYYFVPFYALLFSSAGTRRALLVPLVASTSIMILPTGNFTLVMALASMLVMVGLQDQASRRLDTTH